MRLSRKTKLLLIASGIIMLVFVLFVTTKHQYRTGEQAIAGRENVTAALSSITINTGSSEVPDSANITSQLADLAPDSGAYRWIRNGVNIMALNMPFNAGSSQTDFSGNNNAGTLGTGVSYMTSCQVGGCTQFTGVGDISIPHTSSLALVNNMTVSFWANVDTTKAGCFLRHVTTGTGNGFFFCHDNTKIGFEIWGNGCTDAYPYTALTNGWQHIAFTLGSDGRTFSIYRNGVLLGTDVSSVALNNVSTPYLIGTTTDNPLSGDCPPAGGHQYFTGQIDEFKIFPSVLTSSQLSSVYTDESLGGGAPATIVAEQTAPYDTWQLSVTPIDSDGIVGSASLSNEVSVSFGPTSITGTLDTANEAQNIQSVLTLPSGSYAAHNWWVNGSRLMGASIPFQSGSTQTDVTGNGRSTTNSGTAAIVTSGCKVDACLQLNGTTGAYSSGPMITSVANTFTYEFWVNPLSTRATTTEATAGITGTNSQRYVIWPWNGTVATGSTANAGIGVSVGTNGISVFEHTNSHVPSLLVYDGAISGWTHVVIVIQNKQPRLYVNGVLVRTGLTSTKSVYPSVYFGDANTNWGPFNGKVDEYRVYNRALTARQILHNYQEGGGAAKVLKMD